MNLTINERVVQDTIREYLNEKEGEFYYIMDNDGVVKESCRQKTKLDKVITGVKSLCDRQGHTTTLQRDN